MRRRDPEGSPRTPVPPHQFVLSAVAVVASVGLIAGGPGARIADNPRRDVSTAGVSPPRLRIDPNTAPISLLTVLPGLGPARASAIVEERATRPFESPEDLERRVKGIGPATLERIRPYLRFEPPREASESRGP